MLAEQQRDVVEQVTKRNVFRFWHDEHSGVTFSHIPSISLNSLDGCL
jgi:hypothetical protein